MHLLLGLNEDFDDDLLLDALDMIDCLWSCYPNIYIHQRSPFDLSLQMEWPLWLVGTSEKSTFQEETLEVLLPLHWLSSALPFSYRRQIGWVQVCYSILCISELVSEDSTTWWYFFYIFLINPRKSNRINFRESGSGSMWICVCLTPPAHAANSFLSYSHFYNESIGFSINSN